MQQDRLPSVQEHIDCAKTDPAVLAAAEVSSARRKIPRCLPSSRRILFLTKDNTYRRRIEVHEDGERVELFWFPRQELFGMLQREEANPGEFEIIQLHFDATGGKVASLFERNQNGFPSPLPRYSVDVKYLAYRKILRLAEDARKHAERRSEENARLLLWMALLHLARYTYVRKDLPVPLRICIADDLRQGRCELAPLIQNCAERGGTKAAVEQLFDLLSRYEADYAWPAWRWESRALRFGKGFEFDGLVFSESDSRLWRLWDRLWATPAAILPHMAGLETRGLSNLKELKAAIGNLAESLAEMTGALLIGSGVGSDCELRDEGSSDLDVVLLTRGLYLKRFFFQIQRVLVDGIVISERVARAGLRHRAPIVVGGFHGAEILYDRHGALRQLQEAAHTAYQEGPPAVSPGEIAYALAVSQGRLDRLAAGSSAEDPGTAFLLFEEFIHVIYLCVEALGIWCVGEQRILPSLEERKPELAGWLATFLRCEDAAPRESLRVLLGRLRGILGVSNGSAFAESHQRFSLHCCFDV